MGSHPNSLDEASKCLSKALLQNRFDCEVVRLASFSQCPLIFSSFSTMAAAGFIYKNKQIQCFQCRIILHGNLYLTDDMADTHKRISPCCSFIQCIGNRTTSVKGNVSPEEVYVLNVYNQGEQQRCEETTTKNIPGIPITSITTDSGYSFSMRTGSVPAAEQPSTGLSRQELSTGRTSQKRWNSFTVRKNSFLWWPKEVPSPNDLATAGFYYTGSGDHVKCFCCGLELAKWEPNDVPWTEHARKFSDCDYVKKNMPPQQDQLSHGSEEIGAVAQPVDNITEYDMELLRQSGSTVTFSEEYSHSQPYIESTAARAVLEVASGPNAKRHVEKILNALSYEAKNQPTVVQIMGVLLMIEEQGKEHEKSIENHVREKLALHNDLEVKDEMIMQQDFQLKALRIEKEMELKEKNEKILQRDMKVTVLRNEQQQKLKKKDEEIMRRDMQIMELTNDLEAKDEMIMQQDFQLKALRIELEMEKKEKNEKILQRDMKVTVLRNEQEKELKQKAEEVHQQYMEINRDIENLDQEIVKRDVEIQNLEMQIIALNNEIEDLRSKILCGICFASVRNMVLCPCSHFFCCEPCVSKIKEKGGQCPVCRSQIERSQKIYLP